MPWLSASHPVFHISQNREVCGQAPRWRFPLDEPTSTPSGATALLFGALPARTPDSFDAVLAVRPGSFPAGGNAILALGLASQEPHFTLVLSGGITITLCSYVAAFHTILLFLQVTPALLPRLAGVQASLGRLPVLCSACSILMQHLHVGVKMR